MLVDIESISQEINKYKMDYSYLIDERKDKQFIFTSINNSLMVLDKYYRLIENLPLYYPAIIINPSFKLEFF